jgi:hypothetical protein
MAAVVKNDIYVIFDNEGKNLKAVGLMDDATTIKTNDFVTDAIPNEAAKKNKSLSYSLNSLISNTDELKVNDSVLVKVVFAGVAQYLPGKVIAINAGGDVNVELYAYKSDKRESSSNQITITEIPLSNIIKNIPVNEKYSITARTTRFEVSYIMKTKDDVGITETYSNFNAKSTFSTFDKVITINDAPGSSNVLEQLKFITIPILTADGTDYLIQGTGVAQNERIPYYYTVVNTFTDSGHVVRGGKKSKNKTRKNTMPLQFAPGAKRAYLKRRKSSRK